MKLIIVRHGETDRNINDRLPGHHDIPLNATGKSQALSVAKRLAHESIDRIYTSDYLRAIETTEAIAAHHPRVPIIIDANLRERNSGVFAHRPVVEKKLAQKASGLGFRDWKPEGGESLREVKERARRWYDEHRLDGGDLTIVVVSHGLFLSLLLEWALEGGADVEKEEYRHSNAAVTILDVPIGGGPARPHTINDVSHLAQATESSTEKQ